MNDVDDSVATETERVRRIQDKEAPRYDRQISFFERVLFGGGREWVCSRAEGNVLELAAGTARNLPRYPEDVCLTAIELSPEMLVIAKRRAEELGADADLRLGDAQALDFADEKGRRLVWLEHVRSPSFSVRAVQRLLDPLAVRFGADHLVREPLDHLTEAGFEVEQVERSKWGIVERVQARKPEGDGGDYGVGCPVPRRGASKVKPLTRASSPASRLARTPRLRVHARGWLR